MEVIMKSVGTSFLFMFALSVFLPGLALGNDPNLMGSFEESSIEIVLPFDPNDYSFLTYNPGGTESSIDDAMDILGIEGETKRTPSNPVTANDLATHDILIVGWSATGGSMGGLDPNIIENGVTGRVILSGHDADYHTVYEIPGATTYLIQAIDFILARSATGMLVCAAVTNETEPYDWVPDSWGITASVVNGSTVNEITDEGKLSGVYDDLEPEDMSGWGTAYHNVFSAYGDMFTEYELGDSDDPNVVTIGPAFDSTGLTFTKVDDYTSAECADIDDEITYTISWSNSGDNTFYDITIVDYLPVGVTYPDAFPAFDPNTGAVGPPDENYSHDYHTYTWDVGDVEPNDTGSVTITVVVDEDAEPGMTITNVAEFLTGGISIASADETTNICCWDTGSIIYVDQRAEGNNNGTSWTDAYTDP